MPPQVCDLSMPAFRKRLASIFLKDEDDESVEMLFDCLVCERIRPITGGVNANPGKVTAKSVLKTLLDLRGLGCGSISAVIRCGVFSTVA